MDGGCGFLEKSNKREIDALEKEGRKGQGITRRSDGACGDERRRSGECEMSGAVLLHVQREPFD